MEFGDLTYEEIRNMDREKIFFITIGSVEAHGPHLPLNTDFLIAKKIEEEMVKKYEGISLPSIPYTTCYYLQNFSGTISVSYRAVYKMLVGIMKGLAKFGFKYLVICTFHMDIFHLRAIYKAIRKGRKYGIIACEPISSEYYGEENGGHADEKETSLALYLFEDMVRNYKNLEPQYIKIGWKDALKKFDEIGIKNAYTGNPLKAEKEVGKEYFERLLKTCEKGIEDMKNGVIKYPEKIKFFLRI